MTTSQYPGGGYAIRSGGIQQQAANKYNAEPPPFVGRHLWVFVGMWQVANPAADNQVFDRENLITVTGPGCFWCEQEWRPTMGAHCPGVPA